MFVPKIVRVGENLTKLWQKQFCLFFETRCSTDRLYGKCLAREMITVSLLNRHLQSRINADHVRFAAEIHEWTTKYIEWTK